MTIEEKAKAYDKVVERLKDFRFEYRFSAFGDVIEEKFPELKESEDERIRNLLYCLIRDRNDNGKLLERNGVSVDMALAWLEKQSAPTEDELEALRIAAYEPTKNWSEKLQSLYEKLIHYERGEQKSEEVDNLHNYLYGEQKLADKVEPKFKVGDWIVSNEHPNCGNSLMRIVEVGLTDYLCGYYNGQTTYCHEFIDKSYHLWTIQDAKDGDVLSYRDGQWIFIYKGIVNEDTFKYYALLSEKGITVNDAAFSLLTSCIIPATKEQRDQLEKAMTDAGYTFDFEKKELKKIEQKPAWSEEDEVKINRIVACLENFNVADNDILLKDVDWLKSLRPQSTWKPSDEQIGVIEAVINNRSFQRRHLDSLYEQLKKLREE